MKKILPIILLLIFVAPVVSQSYSRTDCPPQSHFRVVENDMAYVAGCNTHGNDSIIMGECTSINGYNSICGDYADQNIVLNDNERILAMVIIASMLVGISAFFHQHLENKKSA